ncbi:MAG: TIGR03364 family FAD-dependent oxidoreductase [Alphaproteobacteria bacterium]|nr:TIGR03364 family FAD-dependent oxidoreductase [Alphaproteobacteria bacterium]
MVGAGILGLAHALAAARLGKRVVVIERDAFATGASIRNFGFVTVTGQAAGDCWTLARRSRDVWSEVAAAARIPVLHEGLIVTARHPEAEAVIDAFLNTEMGAECERLTAEAARTRCPSLRAEGVTAALYSPHELRVESKTALPALARWLAEVHGVAFRWSTLVTAVHTPVLATTAGRIEAETVVVCPGDGFQGLFADRIAAYAPTRCKLQMMRVVPEHPISLGSAVMSDHGLARYQGYADLPESGPLKARLDREEPAKRNNGVHLIVVQSADGSLVVGDTHEYGETLDPFISETLNDLVLHELDAVLDLGTRRVSETWIGTYASADDRWRFTDAPDGATRVVMVTAGCGASTAFGIAEETIDDLFGRNAG